MSDAPAPMVCSQAVHKSFGRLHVLKGVSLQVPRGGMVALLGANGAGKTTTLKAVSNLLRSERGGAAFQIADQCRTDTLALPAVVDRQAELGHQPVGERPGL